MHSALEAWRLVPVKSYGRNLLPITQPPTFTMTCSSILNFERKTRLWLGLCPVPSLQWAWRSPRGFFLFLEMNTIHSPRLQVSKPESRSILMTKLSISSMGETCKLIPSCLKTFSYGSTRFKHNLVDGVWSCLSFLWIRDSRHMLAHERRSEQGWDWLRLNHRNIKAGPSSPIRPSERQVRNFLSSSSWPFCCNMRNRVWR